MVPVEAEDTAGRGAMEAVGQTVSMNWFNWCATPAVVSCWNCSRSCTIWFRETAYVACSMVLDSMAVGELWWGEETGNIGSEVPGSWEE